jgi:hypothetical protein
MQAMGYLMGGHVVPAEQRDARWVGTTARNRYTVRISAKFRMK